MGEPYEVRRGGVGAVVKKLGQGQAEQHKQTLIAQWDGWQTMNHDRTALPSASSHTRPHTCSLLAAPDEPPPFSNALVVVCFSICSIAIRARRRSVVGKRCPMGLARQGMITDQPNAASVWRDHGCDSWLSR